MDKLEEAAKALLTYSFLFNSWLNNEDAKLLSDGETILAVNEEVMATFGYSRAELIGEPVDKLVPENVRKVHPEHRAKYKSHPKNRPMMGVGAVLAGRHKDGTEFPAQISLLRHFEPGGLQIEISVRKLEGDGQATTIHSHTHSGVGTAHQHPQPQRPEVERTKKPSQRNRQRR